MPNSNEALKLRITRSADQVDEGTLNRISTDGDCNVREL
jgi:hypothetical protein